MQGESGTESRGLRLERTGFNFLYNIHPHRPDKNKGPPKGPDARLLYIV